MQEKKAVNIITIKWGSVYSALDVNRVYQMVLNNTSYKVNFYCFTENKDDLDTNIIALDLPSVAVKPSQLPYAYRKEVGLCRDDLAGLTGERVLFFDLDNVIIKNIDQFFDLPKGDEFYIVKDWNQNNGTVGNATVYSWVIGTLGFVVSDFEKDPDYYFKKYFTASQEYLSAKVIDKYGKLNFWPESWICSFKIDCLPSWPMRLFMVSRQPKKEVKILAFHGDPKIDDAVIGYWPIRRPTFIKKLIKSWYKTLLPVKWLKQYLPEYSIKNNH